MALYTFTSQDDFGRLSRLPSPDQTQLYNALGRGAGNQESQDGGFDPLGFLKKKGSSIENAISSTIAAPVSFVKDSIQNASMDKLMSDNKNKMNDIYKKYGYENSDAYYDAKNANENNVFSKYGFNADDFWNKRAEADLRGDKDTVARLEQERADIINRMSAEDADSIRRFDSIQDELKGQASNNSAAVKKSADEYKDWVDNNYLSNKLKQDRGKYLGSAINTLSTATDLLGLTSGPLSNAIQGGIEGVADELEQNGLDNFSWERAGQNALSGAASGAAAGALNNGLDKALGKTGRNVAQSAVGGGIRGALKNIGDSAVGNFAKNIGKGAVRGAASGAVGGAAGAGVSAAMNGGDVLGSAIEGAKQGFLGGATAGGIMTGVNAALNKTPGVGRVLQESNQAANDFRNRYEGGEGNRLQRFGNAIAETANSGDSGVGNIVDNLRSSVVNRKAVDRLSNALDAAQNGGNNGDVKFVRMTNELLDEFNDIRTRSGLEPLTDRQVIAYENAINKNLVNRANEGMSTRDVAQMAYNALTSDNSKAVPGYYENQIAVSYPGTINDYDGAVIGRASDGNTSLKSIEPRTRSQIGMFENQGQQKIGPKSQLGSLPVDEQPVNNSIVPQKNSGVNGANDLTNVFEPNNANIITQRNKLQSIGEQLKNASKTQKYGALYDSLDAKTASRAVKTGAPEALSKLGVRPENYLESAKTSNYINKVVTDLAEKSGVKVNAPTLATDLSADNLDVLMSDTAAKKYDSYIKKIIPDGTTPDEYSAGYLLKKSRELGEKAANLRGNTDDVYSLRQALTDAKYKLRDIATNALEKAEITGDLTNDNVAKGLAKIGANEKIQDYYTEAVDGRAPSISDYIRRSSLFEQARDMGNQIEAEKYTRSASKVATNPITKVWNASGLDEPVNAVLKNTVAPIAGGITRLAGGIVEGAGNAIAKAKGSISNNGGTSVVRTSMSEPKVSVAPSAQTQIYDLIGRNEGLSNAEQARTADYLVNAAQEAEVVPNAGAVGAQTALYDTLGGNTAGNNMAGGSQALSGGLQVANTSAPSTFATQEEERAVYFFPPTGDYWSDMLSRAMRRAKNAEDYSAMGQLYEMYQDSIAKLQKQAESANKSTSQKFTATQQRANAAMNSLNRLATMNPDLGYNLSGIPIIGDIATFGGNDYESEAGSLAQQIGYMVSGANIKEDEARNIGKAYVPQPWDSEQTRRNKLMRARQIIQNYQAGTVDEVPMAMTY